MQEKNESKNIKKGKRKSRVNERELHYRTVLSFISVETNAQLDYYDSITVQSRIEFKEISTFIIVIEWRHVL